MKYYSKLNNRSVAIALSVCIAAIAAPAVAQDADAEDPYADTVYAGDYLSVGFGVALNPSYSGSDDYVVTPLPVLQGSLGGIDINPRAAGLALDFVEDPDEGPGLDLGISGRLRSDRAVQLKDPVAKMLGKLDYAIEVGPTVGVSFPAVLNPYDSLTVTTDARWDIAGAHNGMVIDPSIAYFTPFSEGMAGSLTLSAEYADADFKDYYFSVTPAQSAATSGALPAYQAGGGGFTSVGATLLVGIDLDGDLANGGWGLVMIGGYTRLLGDAKRTPFTSAIGSADQFLGAVGIGYTF